VNARLENGLQVCRDVVAFYKKKAALEESYAKSLIELCKTVPSSAGGLGGLFSRGPPALDKEGTTLRGALLSVQVWLSRLSCIQYLNRWMFFAFS